MPAKANTHICTQTHNPHTCSIQRFAVRGAEHRGVVAALEHVLLLTLKVLEPPLIYCTIHACTHDVRVVGRPVYGAHLHTRTTTAQHSR